MKNVFASIKRHLLEFNKLYIYLVVIMSIPWIVFLYMFIWCSAVIIFLIVYAIGNYIIGCGVMIKHKFYKYTLISHLFITIGLLIQFISVFIGINALSIPPIPPQQYITYDIVALMAVLILIGILLVILYILEIPKEYIQRDELIIKKIKWALFFIVVTLYSGVWLIWKFIKPKYPYTSTQILTMPYEQIQVIDKMYDSEMWMTKFLTFCLLVFVILLFSYVFKEGHKENKGHFPEFGGAD